MTDSSSDRRSWANKSNIIILSVVCLVSLSLLFSGKRVVWIHSGTGEMRDVTWYAGCIPFARNRETEFSRLVQRHDAVSKTGKWKITTIHYWGVTRLYLPKHRHKKYGPAPAYCKRFWEHVELGDISPNETRERTKSFVTWLAAGELGKMKEYLNELEQRIGGKWE